MGKKMGYSWNMAVCQVSQLLVEKNRRQTSLSLQKACRESFPWSIFHVWRNEQKHWNCKHDPFRAWLTHRGTLGKIMCCGPGVGYLLCPLTYRKMLGTVRLDGHIWLRLVVQSLSLYPNLRWSMVDSRGALGSGLGLFRRYLTLSDRNHLHYVHLTVLY